MIQQINNTFIFSLYINACVCLELDERTSCYNNTLLSTISEPREEHPCLTVGFKTGWEFHNSTV